MGFLRILKAALGAGLPVADGGTGGITQAAAALGVLPTGTALQQIRKNAGDTAWEAFTPGAASGDVVGPASAVDNAACRFDTTTGKLIQDCQMSFGDAGGPTIFDNTGGNARGADAVDLQTSRGAATQVASGANACIPGGLNNTASAVGTFAVGFNCTATDTDAVSMGTSNDATNDDAICAGGTTNDATGAQSAVLGGSTNVASGQNSAIVGGNNCTASGINSLAFLLRAAADKYGMVTFGSYIDGVGAGTAQVGLLLYSEVIASASQVELLLQSIAGQYLTLVDGDCYDCEINVVARQSSGVFAAWNFTPFTIQRTGATTSIVGGIVAAVPNRTDAGATLVTSTLDVEADDGNDRLAVKITLANATSTYVQAWVTFNKVKKA